MGTRTYFPFATGAGANVSETQWEQMASLWLDTGVVRGYANTLQVYGDSTGMQVKVKSGRAWIDGYFFQDDGVGGDTVLAIAAADPTNPRIDLVVARLDHVAASIAYVVLTGTPAGSPVAPTPTQVAGGRWELSLATVAVAANASTITAGNVTDQRTYTHGTGYLGSLLEGTAGAVSVTVPSQLNIANDTQFALLKSAGNPFINFASLAFQYYDRTIGAYHFRIANVDVLVVDGNGKLTGNGYYDSGEVAVTNNSAATVSHGLANRPRFTSGYYNSASGSANSKTTSIAQGFSVSGVVTVSATQLITGNNITGATQYLNLYAQL